MESDNAYNCPECEASLDEGLTSCPACNEEIVFCETGLHYVSKSQYRDDVPMCEICWEKLLISKNNK